MMLPGHLLTQHDHTHQPNGSTVQQFFATYKNVLGILLIACLILASSIAQAKTRQTQEPDTGGDIEAITKLQENLNTITEALKQTRLTLEENRSDVLVHSNKLKETFADTRELLREVRTNATNLHTQRSLIEDNSVRLYEILLKINEVEEQIETQINTFSLTINNAEDAKADRINEIKRIVGLDLKPLWMLVATFLVLLMPLAFTLNQPTQRGYSAQLLAIASQHTLLIGMSVLVAYFLLGFGLTYGVSLEGWLGRPILFTDGTPSLINDDSTSQVAAFVLQHSGYAILGAMVVFLSLTHASPQPGHISNAKRLLIPLLAGGVLIPAFAHLSWASQFVPDNRGWLEAQGFIDQSGAVVVHVLVGFFAFILLRKFAPKEDELPENTDKPTPNTTQPIYSAATAMLLLLGWIGLAAGGLSVYGESIGPVMLNLALAAAAGAMAAYLHASLFYTGNYSIALGLGGIVAGLVAISACVQSVTFQEALVIGLSAGLLQNITYKKICQWWLKHPWQAPGAQLVAIHAVCGIWGGLCVVLFGNGGSFSAINTGQLFIQAQGIGLAIAYGVVSGYIMLVFKPGKKAKAAQPATKQTTT